MATRGITLLPAPPIAARSLSRGRLCTDDPGIRAPTTSPIPPHPELEPLRLPWDLGHSQEQFERVCQANPDALLELDADAHLIAMTPTGGETSSRNSELMFRCRFLEGLRRLESVRQLRWFPAS